MKGIFSGEHFYDLAKQARFKPHPLLALLLFLLVNYAAQSVSSVPSVVVMLALSGRYGVDFMQLLLSECLLPPEAQAISMLVQLLSTAVVAAVVILYCLFLEKRSLKSMGLTRERFLPRYLIGALMGMAAFSAVVWLSVLTGAVSPAAGDIGNGFIYAGICLGWVIQGAEEEIACRGFLMSTLSERLPIWAAVLINSAFFSCMHLLNPGITPLALVNILLVGIMLSLVAVRFNSLIPSCALHSVWNWAQGSFYGLPVSGMSAGNSVLGYRPTDGMELWTGGKFGLESGLAATIVTVVIIAALLLIPQKPRNSEEAR